MNCLKAVERMKVENSVKKRKTLISLGRSSWSPGALTLVVLVNFFVVFITTKSIKTLESLYVSCIAVYIPADPWCNEFMCDYGVWIIAWLFHVRCVCVLVSLKHNLQWLRVNIIISIMTVFWTTETGGSTSHSKLFGPFPLRK